MLCVILKFRQKFVAAWESRDFSNSGHAHSIVNMTFDLTHFASFDISVVLSVVEYEL